MMYKKRKWPRVYTAVQGLPSTYKALGSRLSITQKVGGRQFRPLPPGTAKRRRFHIQEKLEHVSNKGLCLEWISLVWKWNSGLYMMLLLGKTELWVHRVPIFIPFMDIGNFINHIAYLPTLVFFFFFFKHL